MSVSPTSGAEWTYPPRDYVPVDASASDVDIEATLGFIGRGVRANADGTLNYRLVDSDADRSDTVKQGEFIPGFFTHLLSGTDCDPRVAK